MLNPFMTLDLRKTTHKLMRSAERELQQRFIQHIREQLACSFIPAPHIQYILLHTVTLYFVNRINLKILHAYYSAESVTNN